MRRLRVGLIPRIAVALTLVGLLPLLAATFPLIGINREALQDQVLQTHTMAARTAAERVASYLSALATTAEAVAGNPLLAEDPRSPGAQQLLAGILEARPDVACLAVVNDQGELVIRAQLRGRGEGVEEALAALGPSVAAGPTVVSAAGDRWLLLSRPLPAAEGRLVLLADVHPLAEAVETLELGREEADLVLATSGGEVVAGSVGSLATFPTALVDSGKSLQATGAGAYLDPAGQRILGAFSPVAASDWFVVSRQPARVAERVEIAMRRRSYTAVGLALLLVALLSAAAHATLVRPIRRLGAAQRRLAGLGPGPRSGDEIEELRSSLEVLERHLKDRKELGEVFLGRYQVLELVGEGAMGSVFLGFDPRLQRKVALKTVRLTAELAGSVRRRLSSTLLREATVAARFSHPNIVAIYDFEDAPEVTFIAMEYVEGIGLDHLLNRRGALSEDQVLCLGQAVAGALAAAHGVGMVHRDIKPSNVLLGYDGAIKVADFGIADFISTMAPDSETVFGTAGYLAPEVLLGDGYGARSDLFSLGVILYEGLTGQHPFFGLNLREVSLRTVNQEPEAVGSLRPDVSAALAGLIGRLIAKSPEDRPASAAATVEEIEAITAGRRPRWDPAELPRLDERGSGGANLNARLLPTLATPRMPGRPA